MTCVSGHLTGVNFDAQYKDWNYPPPETLFDAPVHVTVDEVCDLQELGIRLSLTGPLGQKGYCYEHHKPSQRCQSSFYLDRL